MKIQNILISVLLTVSFGAFAFAQGTFFSDVDVDHENYDAIKYVYDEGIIDGYMDGTFKPDNLINRAEFTKIVVGAVLAYDSAQDPSGFDIYAPVGVGFSDIEDGAWYIPYLRQAVSNGLINGYPDGTYKPANNINFVEASKILVISFDSVTEFKNAIWYKQYVDVMANGKAIPMSITSFDQNITRGEAAEMIYRMSVSNIDKESQSYDSIWEISERATENIVEGWAKWETIDAYKFFIMVEGVNGDETFHVNIDGVMDESNPSNPIYVAEMDLDFYEGAQLLVSFNGELALKDGTIYIYVNDLDYETADVGLFHEYAGKWWKMEVPPEAMADLRESIVGRDAQPTLDASKMFINPEYMGIFDVMEEDSYHYSLEVDSEGVFEFVQMTAAMRGEEMNEVEVDEARRDLENSDVDVEVSIGEESGVLNKLKGVIVGSSNEKMSFVFAAGDFNEPVEFVAPVGVEVFPLADVFMPLMED